MAKYGIIFCGFNCEDILEAALAPWVAARRDRLSGHDWVISVISVPFTGFPQESRDGTHDLLDGYLARGEIDFLNKGTDVTWTEVQARGMALRDLTGMRCALSWQVDSDEFYTVEQIQRIVVFMDNRPAIAWARLSLRNYVFDDKTYLVDPFQPPRIHRLDVAGYKAHSFRQDNDIQYGGTITCDIQPQERFVSCVVPLSVAAIRHMSWLNDERSKRKVAYQWARWGVCDFAWDDSRGGLIWRDGVAPKETARDE